MEISVTDVHWAVRSNDVGMIKKLLGGGSPIHSCDSMGRTPLHWATVLGHEEALKALLMNTSRQLIDVKDKLGRTPLHYACAGGRTDFASILMKRGASVNSRDSKGRTPLHYAAQNVEPDMVELLIKSGADKDVRDCNGARPWDVALKWGCSNGFEVLRPNSDQVGVAAESKNECPLAEKIERSNDLSARNNTLKQKSSSLDALLGEWKKAEAQKKKKEAIDGLKEALKAWREAEAKAKVEKQKRLILQSQQDLNSQVPSSCSSFSYSLPSSPTNLEAVNDVEDRRSRVLYLPAYPNGYPGSPYLPFHFQYGNGGKAEVDDVWGCTEWDSPLRNDDMKESTSGVEKWETVIEWKSLSRLTPETWKEPWFQRRNQAPSSAIEAI